MKSPVVLSPAVQVAIAVIILLGMLGGSLIVAYSGFGTSPRRGGPSTFVPAPEAYFLAATMFGMSIIGMLALLQNRKASGIMNIIATVIYATLATLLAVFLSPP